MIGYDEMKKKRVLHTIWDLLVITFGAVLAAAAIFFFMLPSHVAVGSASALAMIIANFIPLSVSMITLIINVVLLILGFILIGPGLVVKPFILLLWFLQPWACLK